MKIELVEDLALVRLMGYPDTQTRSVGLHLSDIIKVIQRRSNPKKYGGGPFVMNERMETGILFESILEQALAKKYSSIRPAEIVSPEGVAMSPDGICPIWNAGEEHKCTWYSSRHGLLNEYGLPLDNFVGWFIQMMGYAKWLEVNLFILRVLWINGNYNRSGKLTDGSPDPDAGPRLKPYHITFTDEEIDTNWLMLMNVAKEVGLLT